MLNRLQVLELREFVRETLHNFSLEISLKEGEKYQGSVDGYRRDYRGKRVVELVEDKEDGFSFDFSLSHPDLVTAFDRLEPARGDLIEIERLPNAGRRHRYEVRVLSRDPSVDRSYYRKACQNTNENKEAPGQKNGEFCTSEQLCRSLYACPS